MESSPRRNGIPKELWIVAGIALFAALTMVLFAFRAQGLVKNAGDPYDYGKIAHGFVAWAATTSSCR
jgi:hypothetical protein